MIAPEDYRYDYRLSVLPHYPLPPQPSRVHSGGVVVSVETKWGGEGKEERAGSGFFSTPPLPSFIFAFLFFFCLLSPFPLSTILHPTRFLPSSFPLSTSFLPPAFPSTTFTPLSPTSLPPPSSPACTAVTTTVYYGPCIRQRKATPFFFSFLISNHDRCLLVILLPALISINKKYP